MHSAPSMRLSTSTAVREAMRNVCLVCSRSCAVCEQARGVIGSACECLVLCQRSGPLAHILFLLNDLSNTRSPYLRTRSHWTGRDGRSVSGLLDALACLYFVLHAHLSCPVYCVLWERVVYSLQCAVSAQDAICSVQCAVRISSGVCILCTLCLSGVGVCCVIYCVLANEMHSAAIAFLHSTVSRFMLFLFVEHIFLY